MESSNRRKLFGGAILGLSLLSALFAIVHAAGPWWLVPWDGAHVLGIGMALYCVLPFALHVPIGSAAPGDPRRILIGTSPLMFLDRAVRIFGALMFLGLAIAQSALLGAYGVLLGFTCALVGLATGPIRVLMKGEPSVTLDATTMTIADAGGTRTLRYADIRTIEREREALTIVTRTGREYIRVGGASGAKVASALAERLLAAKAAGARHEELEGRAASLVRRDPGSSARAWLMKIDATVDAMRASGGYRGERLDDEELWALLRDDAADPDLRAAAARVLGKQADAPTRVRIEEAVGEAPPEVRVRVAAATKEIDEAAAELESIEAEETKRAAGG
jgi:hypothetical protein